MDYQKLTLREDFIIEHLITVHYYEYMSDFCFAGESHDFWEFLCVDKGEVEVVAGIHSLTLKKGDLIFHKPDEFHSLRANGTIAPNLVVIAFSCNSQHMNFFENRILTIQEQERGLLASIIQEAKLAFSSRLDDPYLKKLDRSPSCPAGSEQLIKLYLEQLLIYFYRRCSNLPPNSLSPSHLSPSNREKDESEQYDLIRQYLEAHLSCHLTIEQICHANLISRARLQRLIQERQNCGIIEYFNRLKIECAKQLIRNQGMTFTQIAETLGYTSIHYFSRQFKKTTGMTPTEYASSIKILSDSLANRAEEPRKDFS